MILDTNALSALLDGNEAIQAVMLRLGSLRFSPVVLGEYRFGLLRSTKRREREAILKDLESTFEVLPISGTTSRHYAQIRDDLRSKGRPIPSNDLWIAAQALEHRLPLLTLDQHFKEVGGLELVTW
jgi:tRNA(fMet)-specific endonuclease VapC